MRFVEEKDLHDTLRAYFQTVDVQHLNAVLEESGVTDLELRKKILENYFSASGQFFDAGWFEAEGKMYSPIVCFREVGSDLKRGDTMVCPDADWGTIFHEMAGGTAEMVAENPDDPNVNVPPERSNDRPTSRLHRTPRLRLFCIPSITGAGSVSRDVSCHSTRP